MIGLVLAGLVYTLPFALIAVGIVVIVRSRR